MRHPDRPMARDIGSQPSKGPGLEPKPPEASRGVVAVGAKGGIAEGPYAMALAQYDQAVKHLNLKRGIEEYLRTPRRELGGIWVFAEAYLGLAGFVWSSEVGTVTFADLLGLPFWLLAGLVVTMALGMFWLLRKVERRFGGGES